MAGPSAARLARWFVAPRCYARGLTFTLVCLAYATDKADGALLPAVYHELCAEFGVGPQFLGTVTLARGLAQSVVALAAGPLCRKFDRTRVIGLGVLGWALATALVGAARSPAALLAARAVNGAGLGVVIPVAYALASDLYPPSRHGRAFGIMYLSGNLGGLGGALLATELAAHAGPVAGWRVPFYLIALLSMLVGGVVLAAAREPPARRFAARLSAADAASDVVSVLRLRSLQVIVFQGLFGSMPWFALGFLVLWLELLGFPNRTAALLRLAFDTGALAGSVVAALLIDRAAATFPRFGVPALAQVSVGSGIPLFGIILFGLPAIGAPPSAYAAMLLLTGTLITWCGPINNTVMAAVTVPEQRGTIYGVDRLLEGLSAPAGSILVGALAEHVYGFRRGGACGHSGATTGDAAALASALAVSLLVPWLVCLLGYSALYFVYARDVARAARARGELASDDAQVATCSDGRKSPATDRCELT